MSAAALTAVAFLILKRENFSELCNEIRKNRGSECDNQEDSAYSSPDMSLVTYVIISFLIHVLRVTEVQYPKKYTWEAQDEIQA